MVPRKTWVKSREAFLVGLEVSFSGDFASRSLEF